MNLDVHPFKCTGCKAITAHRQLKEYECEDVPEAPNEVWLVECQRCFTQRIIYPSDRVASKEDDICRCAACGNWKMKSAKCRICRIAANQEELQQRYFTGYEERYKPYADL